MTVDDMASVQLDMVLPGELDAESSTIAVIDAIISQTMNHDKPLSTIISHEFTIIQPHSLSFTISIQTVNHYDLPTILTQTMNQYQP